MSIDTWSLLEQLEQAIHEAKISGSRYRPEHRGFDLAIEVAQIDPLIRELEARQSSMTETEKGKMERLLAQIRAAKNSKNGL